MLTLLAAMALDGTGLPTFTRALICPCSRPSRDSYFRTSDFWKAAVESPLRSVEPGARMGPLRWREVRAVDPAVANDRAGRLLSKSGYDGLCVEWAEPVARKALLFSHASRFFINGKAETGQLYGWGVREIVPVALKKGLNRYLADGAVEFQLLPALAPVSLVSDTAILPDATSNDHGPFVASIVAVNTTESPRRVHIKAQVDGGPVTTTASRILPAMESRILSFRFRVSPRLAQGHHRLRLFGEGVAPCDLEVSLTAWGDVCRCTYVSRFDGMVRGYSQLESLQARPNQPIVSFTYGGGRSSVSQLGQIHAKDWCHIVSPEFRTTNWDGLGRRDVLETLEVATKRLRADPTRTYLLGHSMGGHGVYQIAALNPHAFAGIGLSAAWLTNFNYIPSLYSEIVKDDPIARAFRRAMGEVDLESRLDEIAAVRNVWMVHGDRDESVPISESYHVLEALERRGAHASLFVKKGAAHFWEDSKLKANQYDFPPLFDSLRDSSHRGTGRLWDETRVPGFWAECMGRPIVAIYGTQGSDEETQDAKDRARREASIARQVFQVDCEVLPDTVDERPIAGRNVVLLGTPSSNRLWSRHPTASKILARAREHGVRFTSWMIQGRRGTQTWSALGGLTAAACRLSYYYDLTDSYRRFPQWLLFDRSVTYLGLGGVAATGFLDGREAWRN